MTDKLSSPVGDPAEIARLRAQIAELEDKLSDIEKLAKVLSLEDAVQNAERRESEIQQRLRWFLVIATLRVEAAVNKATPGLVQKVCDVAAKNLARAEQAEAQIAALTQERETATKKLHRLRSHCFECRRSDAADEEMPAMAECIRCGELDCPHSEALHYHHDGCPACIGDSRCDPHAARIPLASLPAAPVSTTDDDLMEISDQMGKQHFGRPLEVRVERGALVIRIGVDVLAHAVTYSDWANQYEDTSGDYFRTFAITDAAAFAMDVQHAMLREREDGSTPLSDFLDKMTEAAVDDGPMACEYDQRILHGQTADCEASWAKRESATTVSAVDPQGGSTPDGPSAPHSSFVDPD